MKNAILGMCCMILRFSLLSQTIYHDGYVVLDNNDTIRGKIGIKDWRTCPVSYKIVSSTKGNVAFTGNDHHTLKMVCPEIGTFVRSCLGKDTVLVRLLVNGTKVSLYEYTTWAPARYFICKQDSPANFIELEWVRIIKEHSYFEEYAQYRDQLFRCAKDVGFRDQEAFRLARQTEFRQESLVNAVETINGLKTQSQPTVKPRVSGISLFLAVNAGTMKTQMSGSNPYVGRLSLKDFFTPSLELGFDWYSARYMPNLQGRTWIGFYHSKISGTGMGTTMLSDSSKLAYGQSAISLGFGINYKLFRIGKAAQCFIEMDLTTEMYIIDHLKLNLFSEGISHENADKIDPAKLWLDGDIKFGVSLANGRVDLYGYYKYIGPVSGGLGYDLVQYSYGIGCAYHIKL